VAGSTPGAGIANAFFDATSVLEYPLTPERVKAALATRTWMPL
jgi:CO/xanthine dehydrogenase Mo-binding subunit